MVYRIYFSGQDLARTRVADAPLPMCELRLAMLALRSRSLPLRLDPWRRRVRERLPAAALAAFAGIAPPSAGEHATVLRQAGLIHTVRHRNAALHSPTSLGMSLLSTSGDRA